MYVQQIIAGEMVDQFFSYNFFSDFRDFRDRTQKRNKPIIVAFQLVPRFKNWDYTTLFKFGWEHSSG